MLAGDQGDFIGAGTAPTTPNAMNTGNIATRHGNFIPVALPQGIRLPNDLRP